MPSRRHSKPLPKFSFLAPKHDLKGTARLEKRSNTARRHAAYWGGPARHQHRDAIQNRVEEGNIASRALIVNYGPRHFDAELLKTRCLKPRDTQATKCASPYDIQPDHLQFLPSVPPEIRLMDAPLSAALATFKYYGTEFIKQFIMYDHEDYFLMFSGCLLLSYAHYIALTGFGTKPVLLELKSLVIHQLSKQIESSNNILSPLCLTAILALGAPILCLVSREIPNGVSIREYIHINME